MDKEQQYMATFLLPENMTEEFLALVSEQQEHVERYLAQGILVNYALSIAHARLWAVFNGESEMEVLGFIAALPLSRFMEVEVSPLAAYDAADAAMVSFSLN